VTDIDLEDILEDDDPVEPTESEVEESIDPTDTDEDADAGDPE